jgi:hypothetical protein
MPQAEAQSNTVRQAKYRNSNDQTNNQDRPRTSAFFGYAYYYVGVLFFLFLYPLFVTLIDWFNAQPNDVINWKENGETPQTCVLAWQKAKTTQSLPDR